MESIRLLRAAAVATLVMLGINALWYSVLMRDFYDRTSGSWVAVSRDNPSIVMIVISFFALAVLLAVAYRWVRPVGPRWATGLAVGVVVGLVYILPPSLYYLGTTDILDGEVVVADVLWHMIEEGAAGLVVAWLSPWPADKRPGLGFSVASHRPKEGVR